MCSKASYVLVCNLVYGRHYEAGFIGKAFRLYCVVGFLVLLV